MLLSIISWWIFPFIVAAWCECVHVVSCCNFWVFFWRKCVPHPVLVKLVIPADPFQDFFFTCCLLLLLSFGKLVLNLNPLCNPLEVRSTFMSKSANLISKISSPLPDHYWKHQIVQTSQSPVLHYSIYPLSFHSETLVITFWVSFPDKFQGLLEQEGAHAGLLSGDQRKLWSVFFMWDL